MAKKRLESICIYDHSVELPGVRSQYFGKVRDVYFFDDHVVMVVSDRISAFDHILPRPIPFKGQVLNGIAAHFLNATRDLVPNWLQATPHPNVSIGLDCTPIRLEMVVRGFLTGHAWRTYRKGLRTLCGVVLPEGMKEHDPFPEPIITPATKAETGHDEDISEKEILQEGILTPDQWNTLKEYSLALYQRGREMAEKQGLILVDTKYEFGWHDGQIILIDEIHTPDSSRYFYREGFEDRQRKGEPQPQLSKEFVREWLMGQGFNGQPGQALPDMSDDFVWEISQKYRVLYQILTGSAFDAVETTNLKSEIETDIVEWLKKNG